MKIKFEEIKMNKFQKKLLTLRQQLVGAKYFNALACLEFASKHHVNKRKNGDPEFDHQVSIALYALTLPDILYREELICVIMLHDVREDYNITDDEIRKIFIAATIEFINRVSRAVENMTKVFRNEKKDGFALFAEMALDPVASIAKGCDRINNIQTMLSVFTIEKQKHY